MEKEIINLALLLAVLIITMSLKYDLKKVPTSNTAGRRQLIIDTSILIDGRILSLAKTGFIGDELIIPRSVIGELQLLADGNDSEKRSRARFGLDVISELQALDGIEVTLYNDNPSAPEGVDNRLMKLSKENGFLLLTLDYNLNKVAKIDGITVLNINELAQVLKMQVLPGEVTKLKLTQAGQNVDQAVGYLDDGTMVVVSNARALIGQTIEINVVRSIQTEAGKMVFAEVVGHPRPVAAPRNQPRGRSTNSSNQRTNRQPSNPSNTANSAKAKPADRTNRRFTGRRKTSPEDRLINSINRG